MKISSIVDITGGKLLNSPAISFTTQTHTNLKKVSDGDLFISSNKEEIEEAIKKGAFGIIFDFNIDVASLDNEIAWIQVEDINRAITKLLRFKLANLKLQSYKVDLIGFEFLTTLYKTNKKFYFVEDIFSSLEYLQEIETGDFLISQNSDYLNAIYPRSIQLPITKQSFENLIIHSIFETSFTHKGEYFYKIRIPYIYLDHLLSIKEIFEIEENEFPKLKSIRFLQPIFLSKNNQIIDYGKSNRFLITNQYTELVALELGFIQAVFPYGKTDSISCLTLDDEAVYEKIANNTAHCLYLTNISHQKIIEILQKNKSEENTLF